MNSEAALNLSIKLTEPLGTSEPQRLSAKSVSHDSVDQALSMAADEMLLLAVGKGDTQALGILFRRHGRSVLNVARRILRDEAEAEDLRQDVFLYLFQRSNLYDSQKGSAISRIMQTTYHRAFDRKQFLTHRQHYKVESLGDQQGIACAKELSTDQIDGKVILEKLREQLTSDQQRTLELHFFEGYTLREIAAGSGESIGNIRHHYYRALERLRSNVFSKKPRQGEKIG